MRLKVMRCEFCRSRSPSKWCGSANPVRLCQICWEYWSYDCSLCRVPNPIWSWLAWETRTYVENNAVYDARIKCLTCPMPPDQKWPSEEKLLLIKGEKAGHLSRIAVDLPIKCSHSHTPRSGMQLVLNLPPVLSECEWLQ